MQIKESLLKNHLFSFSDTSTLHKKNPVINGMNTSLNVINALDIEKEVKTLNNNIVVMTDII